MEEEVRGVERRKGTKGAGDCMGREGESYAFEFCQLESCGFVVVCFRDEPASERRDCGYPGIPKDECRSTRGCCWDDSIPDVKWCFFRGLG